MGESPADDLNEDPPEKVPNAISAVSNPFIESDEEDAQQFVFSGNFIFI